MFTLGKLWSPAEKQKRMAKSSFDLVQYAVEYIVRDGESAAVDMAREGKVLLSLLNDGEDVQLAVIGEAQLTLETLLEGMSQQKAFAGLILEAAKRFVDERCDCPSCQAKKGKTVAVPMTPPSDNIIN